MRELAMEIVTQLAEREQNDQAHRDKKKCPVHKEPKDETDRGGESNRMCVSFSQGSGVHGSIYPSPSAAAAHFLAKAVQVLRIKSGPRVTDVRAPDQPAVPANSKPMTRVIATKVAAAAPYYGLRLIMFSRLMDLGYGFA